MSPSPKILWKPSRKRVSESNINRFIELVNTSYGGTDSGVALHDSGQLYDWSVREPEKFWTAMWSFSGVISRPAVRAR